MPPRLGLRPAFGPAPPTANANGPYTTPEGGTILASRLGSSDPGGGALNCYWTPADTGVEVGPYVDAAADIAIEFDTAGVYPLQLRVVSQTTGLEDIATTYVVVTSVAAVDSVTVEPITVTGSPGQTFPLAATVFDANGVVLSDRQVTWTTANGAVATVSPTIGSATLLTLVAASVTTAKATCEGVDSPTVAVTVAGIIAVGSVVVTPGSLSGIIGQTQVMTATVRASGAETVEASRLYLSTAKVTIGTVPAFAASWKSVTGDWPAKFPCSLVPAGVTIEGLGSQPDGWYCASDLTPWASGDAFGAIQFASAPLAGAATLSGTVKGRMRAREDDSAANLNLACVIRVVSGDGTTIRGTALALTAGTATGGTDPEAPVSGANTGAANRECPYGAGSPVALTPVAYQAGDRLLIEVGARFMTTTQWKAGAVVTTTDLGNGDLPEDTTTTTNALPWIEFSQTLSFQA